MNEDVTLLLLLEARDLATGAVRLLRGEIGQLTGAQKLHAAAFVGIGLAAAGAAAEIAKFTKSGIKQAIDYAAAMTQLHTQARASHAEVKTMNDFLLANGPKWGVGPAMLVRGLYNIESVGARARKRLEDVHATSKELIGSVAKLQLIATAGKPGDFDSSITAQAILAPMVTKMLTQKGKGGGLFKGSDQVAGAINRVVGLGDMRMPDFLRALNTGFLANLSRQGFDWRSTMAAFETLTDAAVPASRAAIYLRQVGAMAVSAGTKPKTQNLMSQIGIGKDELVQDIQKGGFISLFDDLQKHLRAAGKLGAVTAVQISRAFGADPKTKADMTANLSFLESRLTHMSKAGREKLASMLHTSSRATSMATAIEGLKTQLGPGGALTFAREFETVLFGGSRTGSGAALLLGNPARLHERYRQTGDPRDPANVAEFRRAHQEVLNSPAGQIAQEHASIQSIKIALGEGFLPILVKVLQEINKILVPLAKWTSHHQKLAAIIAASMFVFFAVVAVMALLTAAMIIADGAGLALGATMLLFGVWAIGITAAIILIIAIGYELIKHWGAVKQFFMDFWPFLKGLFHAGIDAIKGMFWLWVYDLLLPLEFLARAAGGALGWIPGIGDGIKHATDRAITFIESFRHRAGASFRAIRRDVVAGWDQGYGSKHIRPAPELMSEHGNADWRPQPYNSEYLRPGPGGARAQAGPQPMSDPFAWVGRAWSKVPKFFEKLWRDIQGVTSRAWNWIGDFLRVSWERDVMVASDVWTWFTGWLGSVWANINNDAVNAWNDFTTFLGNTWTTVKNAVIDAFWDVVHWFEGLPGRIWDAMQSGFHSAPGWLSSLGGWIADQIGDASRWLWDKGTAIAGGMWGGIQAGFHAVQGWVGQAGQWVSDQIGSGARWLWDKGSNVAGGMWDGIKSGLNTAQGWVGQAAGWVSSKFSDVGSWLLDEGGKVAGGLWDGIQAGIRASPGWLKSIGGKAASIIGDIAGLFAGAGSWLIGVGSNIAGGIWHGIINHLKNPGKVLLKALEAAGKSMLSHVKSALGKAWGFVSGLASDAASTVTGGGGSGGTVTPHNDMMAGQTSAQVIQSLSDAGASLQDVVVALRAAGDGASANHLAAFGRVPLLANGGIATRAMLAVIGESGPEAVVPLGQMGGMGGSVINIDLSGSSFIDDAGINRMLDKLGSHLVGRVLPGAGYQIRRR